MKTFKIKDWDKFQHYKKRNPPWIKLHVDVFQNYEFSRLQDASKLLALCIWTLASRYKGGEVPADFEYIKQQSFLGDMVKVENLKELILKGFIVDASNLLASCKQSAIPETETEAEAEGEQKEKQEKEKVKNLENSVEANLGKVTVETKGYAFVGKVIKLTLKDHEAWFQACCLEQQEFYNYLDDRDEWLSVHGGHVAKNWFLSTSADLHKRFPLKKS